MKLIIGNKAYSSWSLRGWLACKQSGLPFEELTASLYDEDWQNLRVSDEFAPSSGKVPILWDGETVVWDSLAIIDWLGDKTDRDRFWPKGDVARGMARSMAAEMHSGYMALRRSFPMNTRKTFEEVEVDADVRADIVRIITLWAEARSRFGGSGPYLFGTFSAADIMFAPIVSRFSTYGFTLPRFATTYMEAIMEHPWMTEWFEAAEQEPWTIERFEHKTAQG